MKIGPLGGMQRKGASPTIGAKLIGMRKPIKIPDPLKDVVYTEDEQENCKREYNALQLAFMERQKREQVRFERATDSQFWFALCFRTRAQKEEFLRLTELSQIGDMYLDGEAAAMIFNIQLTEK